MYEQIIVAFSRFVLMIRESAFDRCLELYTQYRITDFKVILITFCGNYFKRKLGSSIAKYINLVTAKLKTSLIWEHCFRLS